MVACDPTDGLCIPIPDFGGTPAPSVMPAPAPVQNFIGQVENKWSAWWDFSLGKFENLWGGLFGAATASIDDVRTMVTDALSWEHTLWSSFHTLQTLLTVQVWDAVNSRIDDVLGFAISNVADLGGDILNIETWLADVVAPQIAGLEGELHGLERWTVGAIDGAVNDVKAWSIDNIYHPLLNDLTQAERSIEAGVGTAVDTLQGDIADAVNSEAAQRVAAVAGIIAAVGAISAWVDDCGEPMCQTLGPKTDLGKFLKALQLGADLALFAELSNLTESDVQALFAKVAHWAGVAVDAFDSTFVQSGGRLRDVLADVGL